MTASDIISLAVNCRQNDWRYPDWLLNILGCDSTETLDAMLDEIHEQIVTANRLAVERRMEKGGR